MIAIAQRASRHAIRQARSWGWPFALGVAALAVAGAFAVALAPQVRRDAQELGAAADRALKRATTQGTRTGPTDRPVESAPRRFLESFPGEDARQARLATLRELAGHHAL